MNYAVELGSGALIYIQSFTKIGSVIQKLTGDRHLDRCPLPACTHTEQDDLISMLLFFQNKECKLKTNMYDKSSNGRRNFRFSHFLTTAKDIVGFPP
jgi:hypothetical protein